MVLRAMVLQVMVVWLGLMLHLLTQCPWVLHRVMPCVISSINYSSINYSTFNYSTFNYTTSNYSPVNRRHQLQTQQQSGHDSRQ